MWSKSTTLGNGIIIRRCLYVAVIGLLSLGILSSCRSAETPERVSEDGPPPITAQASADIIIVERSAPRLTRVQTVPSHVVLSPGETIRLSAISFDQEGREIKGVNLTWQVVDSDVGSITARGVFRAGFANGTFSDALVVTGRAPSGMAPGMVQASTTVTVAEFSGRLEPKGIRVFPKIAELEPKEKLNLVALAVDANGVAIPHSRFNWETLEPLAGSIDQDGRLTAGESMGLYRNAIRVSLVSGEGHQRAAISSSLDVRIVDPASVDQKISATLLPQVISLRPKERFKFAPMVLDRKGYQLAPTATQWEIVDARAGVISQNGRFAAGDETGIYSNAVSVTMEVAGADRKIVAKATVIIVDVAATLKLKPERLARVAIFPEQVVLSPGESTRVSIIGLNGDIQGVPNASVSWSLSPPEVGEVSRFVTVTAKDFPGTYERVP